MHLKTSSISKLLLRIEKTLKKYYNYMIIKGVLLITHFSLSQLFKD